MMQDILKYFGLCALAAGAIASPAQGPLPGTAPLAAGPEPAAAMSAGIDKFLTRELERAVRERQRAGNRDASSPAAREPSVPANRRLREMTGEPEGRAREGGPDLEVEAAPLARGDAYTVQAARWPVAPGVHGEGLLLRPAGSPVARVVAIPDAAQTPEMAAGLAPGLAPDQQFARRLAENGCEVLAMVLIDRGQAVAAGPTHGPATGQSRREVIARRTFPLGTTIIGLEARKVMAALEALNAPGHDAQGGKLKLGVVGYAEGGLIALYAAALEPRIDAVLVSGYFAPHERIWEEPIDRSLFGGVREFGNAELASLIAPRSLIIEYSPLARGNGPERSTAGRPDAAAETLSTPDYDAVETERERAQALGERGGKALPAPTLVCGTEGATCGPGSDRALTALLNALGVAIDDVKRPGPAPAVPRPPADPALRQERQFREFLDFAEALGREAGSARDKFFWSRAKTASPQEWERGRTVLAQCLWEETLGRLKLPGVPLNARSRRAELPPVSGRAEARQWTAYEVRMDVCADVFAGGYLLMPQEVKEGERRPAVVCQRAMEAGAGRGAQADGQGLPVEFCDGLAGRLADQGFVVFAMRPPEWSLGLERKANPLGLTHSSFIMAQHSRLLEWLASLPFVDPARVGFYGLSHGPATAFAVPAILDGYSLAVCSIRSASPAEDDAGSGVPPPSGEGSGFPGFGMEARFGLAELAALIAPRPVMLDCAQAGTASGEELAAACAKARGFYERLGIGTRAVIVPPGSGSDTNATDGLRFLQEHLGRPPVK